MSGRSRRDSRMLCWRPSWRRQTKPSSTSLFWYSRTFDVRHTCPGLSQQHDVVTVVPLRVAAGDGREGVGDLVVRMLVDAQQHPKPPGLLGCSSAA